MERIKSYLSSMVQKDSVVGEADARLTAIGHQMEREKMRQYLDGCGGASKSEGENHCRAKIITLSHYYSLDQETEDPILVKQERKEMLNKLSGSSASTFMRYVDTSAA